MSNAHKAMLVEMLTQGYDVGYKRLNIFTLNRIVGKNVKYQVFSEDGKINQLYDDPEEAVERFLRAKTKQYRDWSKK